MFGEGREQLRAHIKNKRTSEDLEEIPDDLFEKKAKHDWSHEEAERLLEKRKRNKEAAEKSRKKKKEEFKKLQNENDQLSQDNCELVAMVEKLKKDMQKICEENGDLRSRNSQLKRWIAKRARELDLIKYSEKKDQRNEARNEFSDANALLQGDPSVQTSGISGTRKGQLSDFPSSSPKFSGSPQHPASTHLQGAQTILHTQQAETPWLMKQSALLEKKDAMEIKAPNPVGTENCKPLPPLQLMQPLVSQSVPIPGRQPIVCLPQNMVIVIPDETEEHLGVKILEKKEVAMIDSKRQQTTAKPEEAQSVVVSNSFARTMEDHHGDVHENQTSGIAVQDDTSNQEAIAVDTATLDAATTTAIESLLKLGYKIHIPQLAEDREAQKATPVSKETKDTRKYCNSSDNTAVPHAGNSSATIIVNGEMSSTNSSCPQQNQRYQLDIQKLIAAGYAMPMPSVSPFRAID